VTVPSRTGMRQTEESGPHRRTVSVSSAPSRLLNAAAREVLKPIGLIQRWKSRTWIDDHGCWLIVVNFESSAFSKGSYLAVSADSFGTTEIGSLTPSAAVYASRLAPKSGSISSARNSSPRKPAGSQCAQRMRCLDTGHAFRRCANGRMNLVGLRRVTSGGSSTLGLPMGCSDRQMRRIDGSRVSTNRGTTPETGYWRPKPARRSLTRCWQTVSSSVPRLPRRYDDSAWR
jgi:hypothetical protein